MKYSLAFLFFTLIQWQVGAQSFTIYNYTVPDGLPSSEVYDILQDRTGFLWFATDNGVVRFDGNRMEAFHTKDGLSDPVVFNFLEDPEGKIWFRTFSGKLSYFENGKIKRYAFNEKLARISISGILNFIVRDNNELWFTIRNIYGKIDSVGTITSHDIRGKGLYYKKIDDNVLLGTSNSLGNIESISIDGKFFPIQLTESAYQNSVHCSIRWNTDLLFSINRDIFAYDGAAVRKVHTGPTPIISISKDRENNLWVGYLNSGVERYLDGKFSSIWKPEFLKSKSVTKVHHDHEGGFWFSTLENGVYHVPNLLIRHFSLPSAARIKAVIATDAAVLVGDQAGHLFGLNKQSKEVAWVKSFEPPILALFKSQNNKIWISTNERIRSLNVRLEQEKEFDGLAIDFSEDGKGMVWAYGGNHIYRFDRQQNLVLNKSLNILYRSFLADSLLYMADRTGIHIRNRALKIVNVPKDLADYKISNILNLNDSTLLLTTLGNGFILMKKKTRTYTYYNSQSNFIADNIYSSLLQKEFLWLGTEKGLIKIPVRALHDKALTFEYLTRKSGLISDKIDFLLAADKNIWAFSDNSFSIIPESFSMFATRKPTFYVRHVIVNDQPYNTTGKLLLNHRQNNIEIDYGFIAFNNQNVFVRYRLSKDDNWIYTTNEKILLPSLAPAQYAFDLEYSTDNIRWTQASPELFFHISPPWWNTWYTYLAATLVLATLGYFYFRYQQSIYRQKNRYLKIINDHQQKLLQSEIVTLERERNRISKELHDRVGTNLTAIKLMVSRLLQNHKDAMANDVEEQFQVAIHEIKDIIYGLTPPSLERYGLFTGLKNYIGKLTKSVPIAISLQTFGNENQNYELNIIVFRIIQELLTNSIKHSFAKQITVHINSFEDVLNVVYEDDGIGFSYDPLQSGLGLDSIESRIRSVNGTLKFESGTFGISYTIDIPINLNKEVA